MKKRKIIGWVLLVYGSIMIIETLWLPFINYEIFIGMMGIMIARTLIDIVCIYIGIRLIRRANFMKVSNG